MVRLVRILLAFVALVLIGASFLPLLETNAWWVRVLDFPRLQLSIALGLVALLLVLLRRRLHAYGFVLLVAVFAALGYHAVALWPYLPRGAEAAQSCPEGERFRVMVANVKLGNRQADALLDIVAAAAPDLFLAMETDEWWDRQLSALDTAMPHKLQKITGSYFGIHLFSRLPLTEQAVRFPLDQSAPAVTTDVALPGGRSVRFIGLHPRPPHPFQSSTGRDGQLMRAALAARESDRPAIVAGDFNAVPWERTVERLQRIGALLDPRQRFGYLPTYDAQSWWMSWPLDQILHQADLTVLTLERLPAFGSDHYPFLAVLCARESGLAPPALHADDLHEAEATIGAALGAPAAFAPLNNERQFRIIRITQTIRIF